MEGGKKPRMDWAFALCSVSFMPYPFKSSQNLRVSSVLEAPCCIRISPRVNGTIFCRHTTPGGGSAGMSSGWDKGQIHLSQHLKPLAHKLTAWKHNDLSVTCSTPTSFPHGRVCTYCSLCHADLLFHSLHLANSYLSLRLVVLKVWSPNHQSQHHPGAY